ncbi:MAG: DUF1036 domain-containing protein, partial [Pseudomonadota bacterium]
MDMLRTITKTALSLALAMGFVAAPHASAQVGMERVWAQWGDGKWYPGYIDGRSGQQIRVMLWDGDKANLPQSRLRADFLAPGQSLYVRKRGGNKRAELVMRHGNALEVRYPDGKVEAVDLSLIVLDNPSTTRTNFRGIDRPAVLANFCNKTSERVYYAMAMSNFMVGTKVRGWSSVAPGKCVIRNMTNFWKSEFELFVTDEKIKDNSRSWTSPTFVYAQTRDAFQSRLFGGMVQFGTGLRWGGTDGKNEFCITDNPIASFRHVIEPQDAKSRQNYCQQDKTFKVSFDQMKLPSAAEQFGAVVDWTFSE